MKDFDKFIEEAATKRCPPGKYYDGKKCIIVPRGYHVGRGGYIEPDENGKNGSNNGNGNGNGHNGNGNGGNGNGNGGNGGGGHGG